MRLGLNIQRRRAGADAVPGDSQSALRTTWPATDGSQETGASAPAGSASAAPATSRSRSEPEGARSGQEDAGSADAKDSGSGRSASDKRDASTGASTDSAIDAFSMSEESGTCGGLHSAATSELHEKELVEPMGPPRACNVSAGPRASAASGGSPSADGSTALASASSYAGLAAPATGSSAAAAAAACHEGTPGGDDDAIGPSDAYEGFRLDEDLRLDDAASAEPAAAGAVGCRSGAAGCGGDDSGAADEQSPSDAEWQSGEEWRSAGDDEGRFSDAEASFDLVCVQQNPCFKIVEDRARVEEATPLKAGSAAAAAAARAASLPRIDTMAAGAGGVYRSETAAVPGWECGTPCDTPVVEHSHLLPALASPRGGDGGASAATLDSLFAESGGLLELPRVAVAGGSQPVPGARWVDGDGGEGGVEGGAEGEGAWWAVCRVNDSGHGRKPSGGVQVYAQSRRQQRGWSFGRFKLGTRFLPPGCFAASKCRE